MEGKRRVKRAGGGGGGGHERRLSQQARIDTNVGMVLFQAILGKLRPV